MEEGVVRGVFQRLVEDVEGGGSNKDILTDMGF